MRWLLPPLPPKLEAALRDVRAQMPESRVAAARRLGQAEGSELPEAARALEQLMIDAHPSVRAAAVSAALSLKEASLLGALRARFDDEAGPVRELAVIAVIELGGDHALELLTSALHHTAPEVRFQAVEGLFALAPERALEQGLGLLEDPDPQLRVQILSALGRLGRRHLSGVIAGRLDDEVPEVRLEAALSLARLRDERGRPLLLDALVALRRLDEVAEALATLGVQEAVPQLWARASSIWTPGHTRALLGAALYRLGDLRGVHVLRRALRSLRADVAGRAAELVAAYHVKELSGELCWLSQRPRRADRLVVIDALASFLPDAQVELALQRLARVSGDVGAAARARLAGPSGDKSTA